MEVAIPLLALGGIYVISNQNKNKKNMNSRKEQRHQELQSNQQQHPQQPENFTNMGRYVNYLPNTDNIAQNYPVENLNEVSDTVNNYPNPNTATDKYFDQNLYEKNERKGVAVGRDPQEIYSLTGNYLDSDQFKHNNMVPFVGGKMRGYTYDTKFAEVILDNMVGNSSQTIKKIEQAPLFKPEANMNWAYGAPNNSDFYQSRVYPGMKNNNIKPFDSVYVGPGLDQGYGVNGSNGFNSGMEARDKWLPYTVDQMRVATNPKLEYELINHEGPAESVIKNVGIIGRVEKQKPDGYFINTQDRWLTTTGAEKGERLRPIEEMGVLRRNDIETDYVGPAGAVDRQATTAPMNFEPSKRHNLPTCDVNHSVAVGRAPSSGGDVRIASFSNPNNHRTTVKQPETMRSGFSRTVGAVIAPLMDVLRPSRKEEVMNNVRIYGDVGTNVPSGYVVNPYDTTPTTVKETTLYSPQFNINNQKESMYVNNYTPMDLTQRDTTSCNYIGTSGGQATQYGDMSYTAAYNQHNNDIKSSTIDNHPNPGGMQIFNQEMNVTTTKSDSDRLDGRVNPAYSYLSQLPPSVNTYGAIRAPQYYNECAGCDRIQPEILDAFRANPYTFSLTDSA
uniref:Uncharacterized protein n=1 Tax=viral metagenome TaxID=1070528 RepID=A0A6C0DK25_9ZZZZ